MWSTSLSFSVCLFYLFFCQILKLGPIASFLRKTMDPPADKAIELAITHLVDLVRGYSDEKEK